MSQIVSCGTEQELESAVDAAAGVVADGECIVLPTDTVYGIGCDAFSAPGVQGLLAAKGRTREMPPPVLIARPEVMEGLADQVSEDARALARAFWPGALTIVCWAQPSLGWDLGETHGTVALRVPDDAVTRAVLSRVGPMAVSSANRTGMPAARTAHGAREMLQDRVGLYLDDGTRPAAGAPADGRDAASTIVDCTGETPVVLRHGAIPLHRLREVVPAVHGGADEDAHDPEQPPAAPGEDRPGHDLVEAGALGGAAASTRETEHNPGEETPAPGAEPTETSAGVSTPRAGQPAPAGERGASTAPSAQEGAGSDEEVIALVVLDSAGDPPATVDQERDRPARTEPRWEGTSALSMQDAQRLVTGEDPAPGR